ncbi:hypothetical protein HK099_007244 [Clydaea vesicula]|uniref:SH3 domain-containing protein n=1 Tax=Clydaea vesicula TaxID=447962 RepID=A0AAD5XXN3_9FUNG|nr:hypothetical protein HK099_007244 [Clydaea vesicula]
MNLLWRTDHQMITLNNKVYVLGGRNQNLQNVIKIPKLRNIPLPPEHLKNSVKLAYANSTVGIQVLSGDLNFIASNHLNLPYFGMSCVSDNKSLIYCTGGFEFNSSGISFEAQNTIITFDVTTNTYFKDEFTISGSNKDFRRGWHSSTYNNGTIYLIGGSSCEICDSPSVYSLSESLSLSISTKVATVFRTSINTPKLVSSCLVNLNSTSVLILGGTNVANVATGNNYILNLISGDVENYTSLNNQHLTGMTCQANSPVNPTAVYIYGNCSTTSNLMSPNLWKLDLKMNSWKEIPISVTSGVRCSAASTTFKKYILFHGGIPTQNFDPPNKENDDVLFFDTSTDKLKVVSLNMDNQPTETYSPPYAIIAFKKSVFSQFNQREVNGKNRNDIGFQKIYDENSKDLEEFKSDSRYKKDTSRFTSANNTTQDINIGEIEGLDKNRIGNFERSKNNAEAEDALLIASNKTVVNNNELTKDSTFSSTGIYDKRNSNSPLSLLGLRSKRTLVKKQDAQLRLLDKRNNSQIKPMFYATSNVLKSDSPNESILVLPKIDDLANRNLELVSSNTTSTNMSVLLPTRKDSYGVNYNRDSSSSSDFEYDIIPRNSSSASLDSMRYVVNEAHTPEDDDEISLMVGDVIVIDQIYKDGWAKGINMTTMLTGKFPMFRVETLAKANEIDDSIKLETGSRKSGKAQKRSTFQEESYWTFGGNSTTEDDIDPVSDFFGVSQSAPTQSSLSGTFNNTIGSSSPAGFSVSPSSNISNPSIFNPPGTFNPPSNYSSSIIPMKSPSSPKAPISPRETLSSQRRSVSSISSSLSRLPSIQLTSTENISSELFFSMANVANPENYYSTTDINEIENENESKKETSKIKKLNDVTEED